MHQVHQVGGPGGQVHVHCITGVNVKGVKGIEAGRGAHDGSGPHVSNVPDSSQRRSRIAVDGYLRRPGKIGEKEVAQGKDGHKALSFSGIYPDQNSIAPPAV